MKKLIALFLSLSLLLVCTAQAETADTYEMQFDGAKMILDNDWQLQNNSDQGNFVVYPFAKDGDIYSRIIIHTGEAAEWTLELGEATQQQTNDGMKASDPNIEIDNVIPAQEYTLCNAQCIRFVSQYTFLDANSNKQTMFYQLALFNNKIYWIYFLTLSMDKLEQITEIVDTHFIWE